VGRFQRTGEGGEINGTALVLAGGGARGAFEAGAVSVILPELDRRGQRPTIYAGTSVGLLNAALLASTQHLPVEEQVERMLEIWQEVRKGDIIRSILPRTAPLAAARYAGQLLSIPGIRLPSLLDPAPLMANLERWIDFESLHRNAQEGLYEAFACVTTSARTGRTVVFVESGTQRTFHRSHAIAYTQAEIEIEHVAASAAIPLLWPPVKIQSPKRASGWYVDGGTRLNAPIKPALDLGAVRLVVAAVDSITGPVMEAGDEEELGEAPDFGDGMLHLLEGTLTDPLIEDMRLLGSINAHFTGDEGGPATYRRIRGKEPYKKIPYIFVGPDHRRAIGDCAARVFEERYGGLRGLRSPDFRVLNELMGGVSSNHGELLSLLFFDPHFTSELIEMGQERGRAWLETPHDGDGPWQIGPLQTFVQPRQWTVG
jgi:NTE family protein